MASPDTDVKTPPPARPGRSRRVPKRMTLREFEAFDTNPAETWELVDGVPYMSPSAIGPHNDLEFLLCSFLKSVLTVADGWYVVQDTSARFSSLQSEVRPDVAAYRQSELKDPRALPYRCLARLLIECLSPGNAHYDLNEKKRLYHKAGVQEYWVVDPKTGAISLFVHKKVEYEQLTVDAKGFIASPLLKRKLRIVVKPWTFEIVEG